MVSTRWTRSAIRLVTTAVIGAFALDGIPPTISAFSITPVTVSLGDAFTIEATMSDTGGAGLNRIELWRTRDVDNTPDNGSWGEVQRQSLSGDGPVSHTFTNAPAQPGAYWYRVRVVDGDSNATLSSELRRIVVPAADTTPPQVVITSHTDGAVVSGNIITLSGTASDAGRGDNGISSVTINGARANNDTASGSGTANWSRSVTLVTGPNSFTVVARDGSTNQNATTITITITYQPPPPNDQFANAALVSGLSGTVTGTTIGASKEDGEPNHGGNSGGASVWYRWQPPSSGVVYVNTAGSGFNTLLAIYTGSSVNALTLISQNDDSDGTLQSRVAITASSTVTYYIAVDGFTIAGGAPVTGNVTLNYAYLAPEVSTPSFSSLTPAGFTATATVNPNGNATLGAFEWGTTNPPTNSTTPRSMGSGTSATSLSEALSGLTPGTLYYVRTMASSNGGVVRSAVVTVTTPVPPTITTASPLPAGTRGVPYSVTLQATGGTTPYTWSIVSGTLPSGLNLSGDAVSGTPSAGGVSTFRIRVTGADSASSERDFELTICDVAVSPGQQFFAAAGGTGSLSITTLTGCSWSTAVSVDWIVDVSPNSGSGSAAVNYTVNANPITSSRTTTIAVGGQPVQITQSGAFTDPSPAAQVTPIRAAHILELRQHITDLRSRFGTSVFEWTDPTLDVGTPIRAVHIAELRTALNGAYIAAGRAVPTYTDPDLTPGVTVIQLIHLIELRNAVVVLEGT